MERKLLAYVACSYLRVFLQLPDDVVANNSLQIPTNDLRAGGTGAHFSEKPVNSVGDKLR